MGGGGVRGKPRSARARPSLGRASGSLGRVHECTRGERGAARGGGAVAHARALPRAPLPSPLPPPFLPPPFPSIAHTHTRPPSCPAGPPARPASARRAAAGWGRQRPSRRERGGACACACVWGGRTHAGVWGAQGRGGGAHARREEKRRAGSELAASASCFHSLPPPSPLSPHNQRQTGEKAPSRLLCVHAHRRRRPGLPAAGPARRARRRRADRGAGRAPAHAPRQGRVKEERGNLCACVCCTERNRATPGPLSPLPDGVPPSVAPGLPPSPPFLLLPLNLTPCWTTATPWN